MKPLQKEKVFASVAALAVSIGGLTIGVGVANAADCSTVFTQDNTVTPYAQLISLQNVTEGHTYSLYKIGDYASASIPADQVADPASVVLDDLVASSLSVVKATDPAGANDFVESAAADAATQYGWTTDQKFTNGDAVSWAAQLPTNSAQLRQLVTVMQNDLAQNPSALGTASQSFTATAEQAANSKDNESSISNKLADTAVTFTDVSSGWYLITDTYTNSAGKEAHGVGAVVGSSLSFQCDAGRDIFNWAVDRLGAPDDFMYLGAADMKPTTDGGDENPIKTVQGAVVDGATDIFTLQATIPDYSKFDHDTLEYKFIDHPSSKLTIDTGSITVSVGDEKEAIAQGPDTYSVQTAANGDIVIDFSNYLRNAANVSDLAGKVLKVSYTAKIGTLAEDGSDVDAINSFDIDNNGVTVPEGPNDPNPNNPGNDTPIAPDTSLKFKKTDAAGNPLQYAQFTLSMADDPATPIDESLVTVVATSDADGIVEFTNLGAATTSDASKVPLTSTYTITETHAPKKSDGASITADYVDLDGEVLSGQVSITKLGTATDPGTATATLKEQQDDNGLIDGEGDGLTVKNVASLLQLPLTGRAGMVLLGAVVLVLAAGATALALVSRRNKKLSMA